MRVSQSVYFCHGPRVTPTLLSTSRVPNPYLSSPHAHHPLLHSFPTRPSSDLVSRLGHGARLFASLAADRAVRRRGTRRGARSEEHTSELQSLTNVVCRLLLENKKR